MSKKQQQTSGRFCSRWGEKLGHNGQKKSLLIRTCPRLEAFSRYRSAPDIKMPPEECEPKAGDERLPFYLRLWRRTAVLRLIRALWRGWDRNFVLRGGGVTASRQEVWSNILPLSPVSSVNREYLPDASKDLGRVMANEAKSLSSLAIRQFEWILHLLM